MPSKPSLSYILLPASVMPPADDFHAAWNEVTSRAPSPVVRRWADDGADMELQGVTTIVQLMPLPVPGGEAEAAAARSLSAMRAGGFRPTPHAAHLLVASIAPELQPVERLLHHARIVAAFTKASRATSVYEGGAHATHEAGFYVDVVAHEPGLPMKLWNGVSLVRTATGIELLSLGMEQLDLPDLLVVAPAEDAGEAIDFALDLLEHVTSLGAPIPEGETVGRSQDEVLPVTMVPSPLDPTRRVMRVELPGAGTEPPRGH